MSIKTSTLTFLFVLMAVPPLAADDEPPEPPSLLGPVTREEIEQAQPDWVAAMVESETDPESVSALGGVEPGATIQIYFGTWCSDSRRELARFWLALDENMGLVPFDVEYVAVDRGDKRPPELAEELDLRFVPTFIVRREGREVGRMVEVSPNGIERDLSALLSGDVEGVVSAREDMAEARLVRQAYSSADGGERDYFVYLPADYNSDPERRWPVMLFLHGDGERGDGKEDLDWVLLHGPLYEAWIQKRDLPFIILGPQLPLFGRDKTVGYIRDRDRSVIPRRLEEGVPPRPEEFATPEPMAGAAADAEIPLGPEGPPDGWPRREEDLLKILDQALESYRGDPKRVYLTGLSYGGYGTWHLASRHPQRFAAVAPVVGWGHPDLMAPLAERRMPVWAFAGGRDSGVAVKYFYAGLNKLEDLGHEDVRFTVHEDRGHDVWKRIYAGQDLYDWLLSHRPDN